VGKWGTIHKKISIDARLKFFWFNAGLKVEAFNTLETGGLSKLRTMTM